MSSHTCRAQSLSAVQTIISEVGATYCPDKRVCIWEVSAEAKKGKIVVSGQTNLPAAKAELVQKLATQKGNISPAIKILPEGELQNTPYGVVNVSVANLRTQPKHSAELATQVLMGTTLRILEKEEGWYRVQTAEDYIAWIDRGGMKVMTQGEWSAWQVARKVVFAQDFGMVYEQPTTTATPVADVVQANIFQAGDVINGFRQVLFPDQRKGYVPAETVMTYEDWVHSAAPTVENVLHTARQFMGRPYLWGGTSAKGIDCSGFTKSVFLWNGWILPRDASQQVKVGKDVAIDATFSALQAGDLLFFGSIDAKSGKQKITHVAIYTGEGNIIHASGSGRVRTDNLLDGTATALRQSLLVAKRIIQDRVPEGITPLQLHPWYHYGH